MGNLNKISRTKEIVLFLLIAITTTNYVTAFPVLPSQFYGDVIINEKYADIGTNISAYDRDGVLCGSFSIEKKGEYIISCKGDDTKTAKDEGAKEDEPISLYVNNRKVSSEVRWHEGRFVRLNLIIKTKNESIAQPLETPSKERTPITIYFLISLFLFVIVFVVIKIKRDK